MNKVIYLAEDASSAQYRYRILNVSETLKLSQNWTSSAFLKSELSNLKAELEDAKLLVILRQTAKDDVLPDLIKFAKEKGTKVIFDLDDLIFDYRYLPLLMRSTNSKNIPYWLGYFWGIRRVAKLADGFLATNDFLAEKLKRSFKKPVAVIPNSLNSKQVKVSEKLCKTKRSLDSFTLGYFSGSPTHAKDFRFIEPVLVKFLEKHLDAKLKIVGYMDFSARVKTLLEQKRIEFEQPVDYLELQAKIAAVNVNLAPLVLNDFTNCKSELKFFESAIVEVPTIASPNFSFENTIKDGETGFLAATPDDWFEKLEYIYNSRNNTQKLVKSAKKYALENYYGPKLLAKIEEAYRALSK